MTLHRHQRCPRSTFPCVKWDVVDAVPYRWLFCAYNCRGELCSPAKRETSDETSWMHTRVRHYNWSFFIFGTLFQSVGERRHHNYELRIMHYALKKQRDAAPYSRFRSLGGTSRFRPLQSVIFPAVINFPPFHLTFCRNCAKMNKDYFMCIFMHKTRRFYNGIL